MIHRHGQENGGHPGIVRERLEPGGRVTGIADRIGPEFQQRRHFDFIRFTQAARGGEVFSGGYSASFCPKAEISLFRFDV